MNPLASVEDLAERVGEPINTPEDIAMANRMLRYASSQARQAGSLGWTAAFAPDVVVDVVLEAAARGFLNPSGLQMERGDMLSLQRDRDFAKAARLTKEELALIRGSFYGGGGLSSIVLSRPDVMSNQAIMDFGGYRGP